MSIVVRPATTAGKKPACVLFNRSFHRVKPPAIDGMPPADIADLFDDLLAVENIPVDCAAAVARAINGYRRGLDFSDALPGCPRYTGQQSSQQEKCHAIMAGTGCQGAV